MISTAYDGIEAGLSSYPKLFRRFNMEVNSELGSLLKTPIVPMSM
jgi:hypothetical protein